MNAITKLEGSRFQLKRGDADFPRSLEVIPRPPESLYVIGSREVLECEGLAIVGARKVTPYGESCADRFAALLAAHGTTLVTGGARGCDTAATRSCLKAGGKAVMVLAGGLERIYPKENARLFQEVIDGGGAIISERDWETDPLPYMFRERNRLTAGLSKGVLIIEAGLPSGTYSTADEALAAGKEVLAVPGPITSKQSAGANRLIYQGATPVIDDATFADLLFFLFGR